MNPEQALIEAMEVSKGMTIEQRTIYFQLLAAASISFLRVAIGNDALKGFIFAAMQDNGTLHIEGVDGRVVN